MKSSFLSILALMQGIYYVITGVWPIVSRRSFEAITGPKVDFWLVRTTGGLISVAGGVLAASGARRSLTPEVMVLGAGSAAVLAASDTIYATRGRISRVYLIEAVAESGLILAWVIGLLFERRKRSGSMLQ